MKPSIKLNSDIAIDIERLIQSRMVILANSGGGKSWAIRRIAEQAVSKVQTIIIDPEGEFASLREKHDFILCGKGADVPVEVRSAVLLATKLLELGNSAIIDLYELHPQERQRFVKLFCDALVNAPKELYHPVLIVLDEAHDYVPEGKPSEATYSVEALASKGRKRGQCLILASQRISKLSKNASAECNNKLIGRASQDVDYIRAGAELGFSKADSATKLRNLKPGEFFAFGPAISDDVTMMKIGDVATTHNKVGYKVTQKVPPASDVIKRVLSSLKDLPQEAEKEAKTLSELKKENAELKRMNTTLLKHPFQKDLTQEDALKIARPLLDALRAEKDRELYNWQTKWQEQIMTWFNVLKDIGESMKAFEKQGMRKPKTVTIAPVWHPIPKPVMSLDRITVAGGPPKEKYNNKNGQVYLDGERDKKFGQCPRAIYSYLCKHDTPRTKTQIAVAVGYSRKSSHFSNSLSELSAANLIRRDSDYIVKLGEPENIDDFLVTVDTSLSKWEGKVNGNASKILKLMLDHHVDEIWDKAQIANETGYSASSSHFSNGLSELSSLGLIERLSGGRVRINPEIINL